MKLRQVKTGRATSMAQGLSMGIAVSIAITLAAAFILAKLVDKQLLPWENVGYGILAAVIFASFFGAWTAYSNIKHQRLLVCGLSGILYWAILLAVSILFYGGQFEGMLTTAGIIFAGCMSVFLLRTPRKKGSAGIKRRVRHR